mgnify:CR=1 FL=1
MLIQKITYIVHGEKESETLSKIESALDITVMQAEFA